MRPFEEIVVQHGPMVLRVCRAVLGRDDAAEDAWSETFLSAMRAYPDLRPDSNVGGWLVTIAHRKAIDQIRRRSRGPHLLPDPPDVASWDLHSAPDGDLRAALGRLAPKQRAAVAYRYLADLSYAEIAGLLDCSETAARRSAADGIAKLRQAYRQAPGG
ncbi:sigma-70 family RNA polymerase sigma factor [soil metagenome]